MGRRRAPSRPPSWTSTPTASASRRATAISALYRYYHCAFLKALRGGWRGRRLAVPTLLLFGARDLYVTPKLLERWEPYADEMRVETVADAGHFLVDERSELVCDRALGFFSG